MHKTIKLSKAYFEKFGFFQTIKKIILRVNLRVLHSALPKNRFGDKIYAYIMFVFDHNRLPNKSNTFNDVLYQIKTSNEILNPLRIFVSDKEFVKLYVKATIGDEYNISTIGILRESSDVERYVFPARCCVKPTHLAGQFIIRANGEPIDIQKIKQWFDLNLYDIGREANYKYLHPKVIIEPLIFDSTTVEDYKFFCYQGKPKIIQVDIDRRTNHTRKYYDSSWEELPFSILHPKANGAIEKPKNLALMLDVASNLSKGFNFIRVDLYTNGEQCYVGELTNCHGNAGENFLPSSSEIEASDLIFSSSMTY